MQEWSIEALADLLIMSSTSEGSLPSKDSKRPRVRLSSADAVLAAFSAMSKASERESFTVVYCWPRPQVAGFIVICADAVLRRGKAWLKTKRIRGHMKDSHTVEAC